MRFEPNMKKGISIGHGIVFGVGAENNFNLIKPLLCLNSLGPQVNLESLFRSQETSKIKLIP